jgi:hypothetical protein
MSTLVQATRISSLPTSELSSLPSEVSSEQCLRLFFCCAQVRVSTQTARRIVALAEQLEAWSDWLTLIQLAVDHRILPLVSHNLERYAAGQLPQDLQAQLKHQAQRNSLRALGLSGELIQVLQVLNAKGIQAVPFKGLMLSLEAYGDSGLRSFDDLDFWVAPGDFFAPRDYLKPQGYVIQQTVLLPAAAEKSFYDEIGEYPLVNHGKDTSLDIHSRLMAGDCSMAVDFSRCWHRLERTQVMGRAVPTLRREDLMIYLCANGMKDGWSYLRSVCDVAALMTHETPLDWVFILREARRMGALRMVRLGMMLASRLLGAPLPLEVSQLRSDAVARWMCDRICDRLSSPERPDAEKQAALEKLLLRFFASEGLSRKWAYCRNVCLRPLKIAIQITPKDKQFISLPHRLNFLYYVIRPIRILSEHRSNLLMVFGYRLFR